MNYATPIRILHSLLAVCMLAQIAIGELMDVPEVEQGGAEMVRNAAPADWITPALAHEGHHAAVPGAPVEETLGFEVHEILGLIVTGLVLIRILLAMTSLPGAGWRELFPWLFSDGRGQLASEVRSQMAGWKQLRLAPPEEGETVARSVHGLILLCAVVMGITGVTLYFGWSTTRPQTEIIELVAETHETVVGVLEALLGAHVLAVILHQRQGHNILARIKPHG